MTQRPRTLAVALAGLVAWMNRMSSRLEDRARLTRAKTEIEAELSRIRAEEEIARVNLASTRVAARRKESP